MVILNSLLTNLFSSSVNSLITSSISHFLIKEYYLMFSDLALLFFQVGFLFNSIRKYGDKHYNVLLLFLIIGYIHLYMFLPQFSLLKEINWEKTPMIFEKQEIEIKALSTV